jgi:DNA-binding NarL/FixJ family response regulator
MVSEQLALDLITHSASMAFSQVLRQQETRPMAQSGLCAYVLATNRLAGEYLRHVLARQSLVRPVLCEQLPQPRLKSRLSVFVVEASGMPLPLGRCLQRLRTLFYKSRIVLVSQQQPTEEILRFVRLGVHGFVDHAKVSETLCEAVEAVAKGHLWIPQEVLHMYVESTSRSGWGGVDSVRLPTPREAEVLELARQRLSNKEIANALKIQEGTVKYHISKIMTKLRIGDRRELVNKTPVARIWEELGT